jgi:DnaJ-class molecular chaperone
MAEKPDYYAVLGVAKTASLDEIKAAFKKIAMKCHPDMLRNKSETEKKEAAEKFQFAKEAQEILTDAGKRATYDKYGHKGLDNVKNNGGTGQSYTDAAGPIKMKTYSEEDTASFFEKRAGSGSKTSSVDADGLTADQRREKNRQERLKNRGAGSNNNTSSSVQDTFKEVADQVGKASSSLKDAALPVDVLERFRDNLKDFLKEVDAAIDRARKNGGPGI